MDQANDNPKWESQARVAIAVGLWCARLAIIDRQPGDQPRNRQTTRVVGVDRLGEPQAQGYQRGIDTLLEFDTFRLRRGLDHLDVENFVKGKEIRFVKRFDLLENPPSCSLGHGRPPCRDRNW